MHQCLSFKPKFRENRLSNAAGIRERKRGKILDAVVPGDDSIVHTRLILAMRWDTFNLCCLKLPGFRSYVVLIRFTIINTISKTESGNASFHHV